MLVLSRKAKQRINIGNDISVVVVAVYGNRVKLGFSAPDNVSIHRDEIRMRGRGCQTDRTTSEGNVVSDGD